jgi:hypothetical protein
MQPGCGSFHGTEKKFNYTPLVRRWLNREQDEHVLLRALALLERQQAHAQARQLAEQQHDYASAAKVLEGVPEHLRDAGLYASLCELRDQVAALDQTVRAAVRAMRLDDLRPPAHPGAAPGGDPGHRAPRNDGALLALRAGGARFAGQAPHRGDGPHRRRSSAAPCHPHAGLRPGRSRWRLRAAPPPGNGSPLLQWGEMK